MARNERDVITVEEVPHSSSSSTTQQHSPLSVDSESKDAIINIPHDNSQSSAISTTVNEKEEFCLPSYDPLLDSGDRSAKAPAKVRLSNSFGKSSNFVHEWTIFLLVTTYFITPIFAYMLFPPKLTEIFWFIYNFTNFLIAASTALEAFMSIAPCRDARKAICKAEEKGWVFPTPDEELLILDLVIVAYLPNEKDIIMDRIHYAVEEIVYPKDKIRINIVYNTPIPIQPLEDQLWEAAAKYSQL
jgi:hypothetical protein